MAAIRAVPVLVRTRIGAMVVKAGAAAGRRAYHSTTPIAITVSAPSASISSGDRMSGTAAGTTVL